MHKASTCLCQPATGEPQCNEPSTFGSETVVSVLFTNTGTRLLYNEWEIFNTAQSRAWENLKVEAIWTRHSFYALIVVNTFRRFDVAG